MSRIPVLAIFAAYQCLVPQLRRFQGYELLPLLAHNAPDQQTGRTGDIDLRLGDNIVEGVEIKHGTKISPDLVIQAVEKLRRTSVKRYYLVSTNEDIEAKHEIS